MKHLIIVKSAEGVDSKEFANQAEAHFQGVLGICGIHGVRVIRGIENAKNRYSFIVEIDMDEDALPAYNDCMCHHEWKEKYASMIEKKAIFDYEG